MNRRTFLGYLAGISVVVAGLIKAKPAYASGGVIEGPVGVAVKEGNAVHLADLNPVRQVIRIYRRFADGKVDYSQYVDLEAPMRILPGDCEEVLKFKDGLEVRLHEYRLGEDDVYTLRQVTQLSQPKTLR